MHIWYMICDNGDGSASVEFYETKELAEIAEEIHIERFGHNFAEPSVSSLTEKNVTSLDSYLKDSIEKASKEWAEDVDSLLVSKLQELRDK